MFEALFGFVDEETGLRKYKKLVNFVAKKMVNQQMVLGLACMV